MKSPVLKQKVDLLRRGCCYIEDRCGRALLYSLFRHDFDSGEEGEGCVEKWVAS